MKLLISIIICTVFLGSGIAVAQQEGRATVWDFEQDDAHVAPTDFTIDQTGHGPMGVWVIRAEDDAPSGQHVLAQTDTHTTNYRFPLAVAQQPIARDVRVSVRCKSVTGQIDQACGLIVRYHNAKNYYITRANPLENNIRLYRVVNGRRHQFANWDGRVTAGSWHELRMDVQGEHFVIYWDGQQVIEAQDRTFLDAGQVGVWTKADSVTYFDDLSVTVLVE